MLGWWACARYWHRCRTWAHNLCLEWDRPDGQIVHTRMESHTGFVWLQQVTSVWQFTVRRQEETGSKEHSTETSPKMKWLLQTQRIVRPLSQSCNHTWRAQREKVRVCAYGEVSICTFWSCFFPPPPLGGAGSQKIFSKKTQTQRAQEEGKHHYPRSGRKAPPPNRGVVQSTTTQKRRRPSSTTQQREEKNPHSPWSSPLRFSLLAVGSRLMSGYSEFVVSSWQFCCTICHREYEFISCLWSQYFFRVWFFQDKFLMRPTFLILQCVQPDFLLSKFSTRRMHIRGLFLAKLSCQIGEALTGLVQKSDKVQPLSQKESLGFKMVLRIA